MTTLPWTYRARRWPDGQADIVPPWMIPEPTTEPARPALQLPVPEREPMPPAPHPSEELPAGGTVIVIDL